MIKVLNLIIFIFISFFSFYVEEAQIGRKYTLLERVRETMSDDQKQKVQRFLKTIQMIESSGGKNFNHPEIESGIHEGHRAIGNYGLMPNTVQEIATRMKRKGIQDDQLRNITSLPPDRDWET